jgi:hypothetical protein
MASTYTLGQIALPGRTIVLDSAGEFYTASVTFPTDTVPYWTVVLTRRNATTLTIYSTALSLVAPG